MKTQTHKGIGGIWGERTGYVQAQDEYLGWLLGPMCIPQGCVSGSNALYWDEWAIRQTAWTHIPVPMTRCRSRDAVVWSVSHVWLFVTLWTAACQASMFLHYLPEFARTHVHWVHDAIQPSHPLSPSSLPTLNLSRHQGLFQWVSSSHQVASVWASA